ncbi:exosortase/archaeosortase family protein [Candidatus Micrarchaeota archaeon]|nr:exosortase/archaeosortase family protein [Candidatus Micrarchaeota archaeon]MBU1930349.1 exosortase/archaeosortase family protein [Candidatus Micrarchaeota archaeon]
MPLSTQNKNALHFLGIFFLVYFVFQFALLVVDLSFLENGLANIEANWTGLSATENKIMTGDGVFIINPNCTGLVSAIILGGIVFGLKKPGLRKKLQLWVAGAIALFVINLGRLYLVVWTGKQYGIELAETIHVVSWFLTALFIIVIWLIVTKKMTGVKSLSELISD